MFVQSMSLHWQARVCGLAQFFLVILLAIFLAGCSHLSTKKESSNNEGFTLIEPNPSRYAYGHGFGETREIARRAAQDELAEMILVNIRTEASQQTQSSFTDRNGPSHQTAEISREFTTSSFSWSNVSLEQTQIDFEQQYGKSGYREYYVRLRIEKSLLAKLAEHAKQKAPALNAVFQLERTPMNQPAQRLNWVVQGRAIALRDGVYKQSFITQTGQPAAFETYFNEQTEQSIHALKAIPLLEPNPKGKVGLQFVLLDQTTGTPQRHADIIVRSESGLEYELSTDSQGYTQVLSANQLGKRFSIVMTVLEELVDWNQPNGAKIQQFREIDSYSYQEVTQAKQASVYFYRNPSSANIRIDNQSLGAPVRHPLANGAKYRVQVRADRYRERDTSFNLPQGAAFGFFSAELEPLQFGMFNLKVPGRYNAIQYRRDQEPWQLVGNELREENAEAGSYAVRIGRLDSTQINSPETQAKRIEPFNPNYQIIQDLVELGHQAYYQQDYPEPRYRHPYFYGWDVGISFIRAGGEPKSSYSIPYFRDGQAQNYGQFKQDIEQGFDLGLGSIEDFVVNVQRYFDTLNFIVQGSVGLRTETFSDVSNTFGYFNEDLKLNSYLASIGAGFWQGFMSELIIASVTVNQALEISRWDNNYDLLLNLPNNKIGHLSSGDSRRNAYQYAEAKLLINLGGLGISSSLIYPLEHRKPFLQLGVSMNFFKSGYRRPAYVRY